jgi:surface antigen
LKKTLAVVVCVAVARLAAAQSNMGFLAKSPAGHFDSRDWTLLKSALREVLNDTGEGARRGWHNEANGHGGTVRALKFYNDGQGRPCKDVQVDSSAGGYTGSYRYGACRDATGAWLGDDGSKLSAGPTP